MLPYRSPIPVAKLLLASVDVLSGGRLIFGAAVGWVEGEFDALGVPMKERGEPHRRGACADPDAVDAGVPGDHHEPATDSTGLKASPMPLQKPRPPILDRRQRGATAFRRVARLGDGWHASSPATPQTFRAGALAVQNPLEGRRDARGQPDLTLRIPMLIERRAPTRRWTRGSSATRHVVRGGLQNVTAPASPAPTKSAGCTHVAVEVSYFDVPAILQTIDIVVEEILPALAQR